MPLLDQPDTSIYRTTKLFSTLSGPGQLSSGGGGAAAGPTAAQQRFGAEQQENAQIAQLAQQYGDDYDGLIDAVAKINPKRGFEMGSALENFRKDAAAKEIESTKSSIAHMDLGVSMIQQAIDNPSVYPTVQKMIATTAPQLSPFLPAPDDPQLNDKLLGLVDKAQSTKDYLAHREKAAQLYFDGDKVGGALSLIAGSKTPDQMQATAQIVKNGGLGNLLTIAPDAASAQAFLATQPKDDSGVSWQLKDTMVNGRRAFMWVNPKTQEVKPAAPELGRPIPPVSAGGGAGVASSSTNDLVSGSVRTTLSGKKYLDMGDFETPTQKAAARVAAQKQGIMAVDKQTGASLRAIDSAKQNAMEMWRQVAQFLPKDAAGRILGGPKNTLSQIFQTHPELGAYGSWRTAAIQQVQALAEPGMGLRINQAEIKAAMENDIPQITDDGPTAAKRLHNLFTMLNNKENDALTRDRSTLQEQMTAPSKVNPFAPKK